MIRRRSHSRIKELEAQLAVAVAQRDDLARRLAAIQMQRLLEEDGIVHSGPPLASLRQHRHLEVVR